jgi:hypothetical protein
MRALLLAAVGLFLMGMSGPPPAASAQSGSDEVAPAPTELSGRYTCAVYWQQGSTKDVVLGAMGDGNLVRRETRGFMGRYSIDAISDPRFDGVVSHYQDFDEYVGPETNLPDRLVLTASVLRVETDDGAWQASDTQFYLPGTWTPDGDRTWEPTVMTGEGAYAGLTALLESRLLDPDCYCWQGGGAPQRCSWELRGVVVPGEMPPMPMPAGE